MNYGARTVDTGGITAGTWRPSREVSRAGTKISFARTERERPEKWWETLGHDDASAD
jgi:hypothetical protein